jgi:uracil-DNA glycosylase
MGNSKTGTSALHFFPARISMKSLRKAAQTCEGCPLFRNATQTVFGTGLLSASIVLVGEQPGHEEDLQGKPFVGPAGRVLEEALRGAGIDRANVYVTNVVKHFKWIPRGKRRLHKKPSAREIAACLPWLEREIELVRPKVLVCLGATAAQALLRRDFKVTVEHGQVTKSPLAPHALATLHPSSILRERTPEERHRAMSQFITDLNVVARLLKMPPG